MKRIDPAENLRKRLRGLDGKDYGGYQSLTGSWSYPDFDLHIDRIPKDPYAPPQTGVYRVVVPLERAGFPDLAMSSGIRKIAWLDFLARRFHQQCEKLGRGRRGTGNSGLITIAEPGQAFLERTSMLLYDDSIEARIFLGLPAAGRSIRADVAESMLFEELPAIVKSSLYAGSLNLESLASHLDAAEDAEFLRESLRSRGLVAFVADGAILPRASGVEQGPLARETAVPFRSPESLRVSIELPHAGSVSGMAIPKGVTLIVGGGFHGKSTLLQALEAGIYNHIPGDGRELCVSHPETVKVLAAGGRSVVKTDISAFITNIPLGGETSAFSTANASGSTSQAASIAEAMEAGAGLLLMDEDTCATNFMIRDRRMQELVAKKQEPITAFVDKVRLLHEQHDISTILVMGGSGDYFDCADCVIQMADFQPGDVTARAHRIAAEMKTGRTPEGGGLFKMPRQRHPIAAGLEPHNDYGHLRITAAGPRRLTYGSDATDLTDVEQLVEAAQTNAIGRAILHVSKKMDGTRSLAEIARRLMEEIGREGLELLEPTRAGYLAQFRPLEFAAVLNRMRNLKVRQG